MNYHAVRKHMKSDCEEISVDRVLRNLKDAKLNYLLIDAKVKPKMVSLPGETVFQNKRYEIFNLSKMKN